MAAGYQDQYLEQGTTFTSEITLDDAYGNPFNLSGFTVASQARRTYYSTNTAIVFNASITDANNGVIRISANSATTANVAAGKLVYDVIITTGNTVTRVLEGQIFVSPRVTR
jgi:hypothetical protein